MRYLTGLNECDCALMIHKTSAGSVHSTLFVNPENGSHQLGGVQWHAPTVTPEQARRVYGADQAFSYHEFQRVLESKLKNEGIRSVYVDLPAANDEHAQNQYKYPKDARQHISWPVIEPTHTSHSPWKDLSNLLGKHQVRVHQLKHHLHHLRLIKSSSEYALLKESCRIASQSLVSVIKNMHRFNHEYQLEAHFDYQCRVQGADGLAYVPVVAGQNEHACIIHYTDNDAPLRSGDLVLMDAGCHIQGYCSDITRTFPVNGRFSEPQARLYDAVLRVQEDMILECRSGTGMSLNQLLQLSRESITKHVAQNVFGLSKPSAKTVTDAIYPHHIGHHLGLDVHDCSSIPGHTEFDEGMCVTVEPGVYISPTLDKPILEMIPKEYHHLGIRIEDDVFVASEPEVLTREVPKTINDLHALMDS